MGNIIKSLGGSGGGGSLLKESYDLAREMTSLYGEDEAGPMLALAVSALASATEAESDFAAARELYQVAVEASATKGTPRSVLEWRGHGFRLSRLALATHAAGDVSGARIYYQEALQLFERLHAATGDAGFATDAEAIRRALDQI